MPANVADAKLQAKQEVVGGLPRSPGIDECALDIIQKLALETLSRTFLIARLQKNQPARHMHLISSSPGSDLIEPNRSAFGWRVANISRIFREKNEKKKKKDQN